MQAAILAAGLGTRLRPLTYAISKALVPVLNRPLLGVLLAQLRESGAHRVAVNTHHLADQVEELGGQREGRLESEGYVPGVVQLLFKGHDGVRSGADYLRRAGDEGVRIEDHILKGGGQTGDVRRRLVKPG